MRTELDDKLCETYPKIFAERGLPMTETCMCWGFSCGDGWYGIIDQLCYAIQQYIDHSVEANALDLEFNAAIAAAAAGDRSLIEKYFSGLYRMEAAIEKALATGPREVRPAVRQVVAAQVKEKFGTLSFYYGGGDKYTSGLISMAESMSGITCEVCGSPGTLRGKGWVQTLCDAHAKPDKG